MVNSNGMVAKKKILFVYDSMMTGGTTTALLSLLNTINQEKYDISLILYTNSGAHIGDIPNYVHLLLPAYKEGRNPFLNSGQRKIIRTLFNGQCLKAIKALIKYWGTPKGRLRYILMHCGVKAQVSLSREVKEKYDIAIGFMEGWADHYVVSKRIQAKKKYVWIHPQYKTCPFVPEIDRPMLIKADGIALVAEECQEQFFEIFPEFKIKTKIVPNIMSTEVVLKKAKSENVSIKCGRVNFCTVCRCDIKVKGLDRMVRALSQLKDEGYCEGVVWHVIGDGADYNSFKNDVERLNLSDIIILYGKRHNPLPFLIKMDAFVLVSRYEGKPISVTEAQILGVPCLVTDYASANSQVRHGYNGIIMDNNYKAIYSGLKTVLSNPCLLYEWKKNTENGEYGNETDITKFYDLLEG